MKLAAERLKATRAQESKNVARERVRAATKLKTMKLEDAARNIEGGVEKTPA